MIFVSGKLLILAFWSVPDWRNRDPSQLAFSRPFRIGEMGTVSDWRLSGRFQLVELGPLWIGVRGTLPDWRF